MSASELALRVENLGKMYRLGREMPPAKTLGGKLKRAVTSPFDWLASQMRPPSEDEVLWALKDVSFEIKKGEVVGFIGHNGAGKSTLLKILSRITEPTTGHAEIHGRIAALLEVGTGMHPELTGRENIYMNGTVLGMRKNEIDEKFDEIIDFSGVEKFLDTPVKRYSSGMRVRLGFAIAAHLEPEILVVDEVLAVGDADFQARCLGKMEDVAGGGRTVLFVSHSMASIERLCSRSILLSKGQSVFDGKTKECIERYLETSFRADCVNLATRTDREGSGAIRATSLRVTNENSEPLSLVKSGSSVCLVIELRSSEAIALEKADIHLTVYSSLDHFMFTCSTSAKPPSPASAQSSPKLYCLIPKIPLTSGNYYINVFIQNRGEVCDWVKRAVHFGVEEGDYFGNGKTSSHRHGFLIDHEWTFGP